MSTDLPNSVGARLAQVRSQMSQAEFAALLGISRSSLLRYEAGERTLDADLMGRLWVLFRTDPMWLITGTRGDDKIWGAPEWEAGALAALRQLDERTRNALLGTLSAVAALAAKSGQSPGAA